MNFRDRMGHRVAETRNFFLFYKAAALTDEASAAHALSHRDGFMIRLSVIILSWNTKTLLEACLNSFFQAGLPYDPDVIVVDNGSGDGSPESVAERFPEVRLIRNTHNMGYAQGINVGLNEVRGDFVLLLESDTEVRPGAFEILVDFLQSHPDY
ncbi:MAG: glycosyltransferase, partial [Planctomycetota bacterium]